MDQARRLRAINDTHPTTIAFASGKGGVGKTNVCVNTAIALAELGKRVLIVDFDIGMANVHILMNAMKSRTMIETVKARIPLAAAVQKKCIWCRYITWREWAGPTRPFLR